MICNFDNCLVGNSRNPKKQMGLYTIQKYMIFLSTISISVQIICFITRDLVLPREVLTTITSLLHHGRGYADS